MRERILGVAKYKTKRQMALFKNGRRMGPQRFANLRGCCSWKMRATLKTLLTSNCRNECVYCAFRTGRNCQRITWETKKLAHVTMQLWKETKICGLFLSSSVSKDSDDVTELQLEVLRTLRKMRYTGYIHLRLMPGVSRHYVKEAVELADRVGINLEAPNKTVFIISVQTREGSTRLFSNV